MPDTTSLGPAQFDRPQVTLAGTIDEALYLEVRRQLAEAADENLVVVALSTLGGDPEVARMMGEDIRLQSEAHPERRFVFLGKTAAYSAGATFMGAFSVANRYLTCGARLMIHDRKLEKALRVNGPLSNCRAQVQALLNEIETSIASQMEGLEDPIRGSKVTLDDIVARAPTNWHLEAAVARDLGLVQAVN